MADNFSEPAKRLRKWQVRVWSRKSWQIESSDHLAKYIDQKSRGENCFKMQGQRNSLGIPKIKPRDARNQGEKLMKSMEISGAWGTRFPDADGANKMPIKLI